MTPLEDARLVSLLRNLSAPNASVLLAMLDTADSHVATVAHSQNESFWSVLVEHGMATELVWDPDLQVVRRHWRTFALTNQGRAALPRLLARAASTDQ